MPAAAEVVATASGVEAGRSSQDAARPAKIARPAGSGLSQAMVSVGRDLPHEIEVKSCWGPLLETSVQSSMRRPDHREVFLVSGALASAECDALVAAAEQHGFGATNYPKSYRGNLRLITEDRSLADAMWARLRHHIPLTADWNDEVWDAYGLNPLWRLAKYYPGDRFQRHCDACFSPNSDEISMFTVNIYMNSEFKGGSTRFYPDGSSSEPDLLVRPERGLCLLFRQPPVERYVHDGEEVLSGAKYLFRSDVMYRRRR